MDETLRLIFCLTTATTFLGAAALFEPSGRPRRAGRRGAQTGRRQGDERNKLVRRMTWLKHWRIVLLLSLLAVLAYLIHIVFIDYPNSGLIRYIETGLALPIVLGATTGVLLHRFLGLMKARTRIDNRRIITVAAPLLIFGLLGLFQPEARTLANRLQSVETPYLSLTVAETKIDPSEEIANPLGSPGALASVFTVDTNFTLGAGQLKVIADRIATDLETLNTLCNNNYTQLLKDSCSLASQATELITERLKQTIGYFNLINNILDCMVWYGTRYNNGLPIQENLSRIAAGYAVFGVSDLAEADASEALFGILKELRRAYRAFGRADQHACLQLAEKGRPLPSRYSIGIPPGCQGLDPDKGVAFEEDVEEELRTFSQCVIKRRSELLDRRIDTHISTDDRQPRTTPYRALFEAYVMVAAGYPAEGALHALRYYDASKEWLVNVGVFGWLFQIRLLSELDSLLLNVEDFRTQHNVLLRLRERLHDYLKAIGGPDSWQLVRELRACVGHSDAETGKIRFRDPYVLNLWMSAILTDARMLYYKARYLSEFVSRDDIVRANKLNEIATNADDLESCFSAAVGGTSSGNRVREIFSEEYLEEIRAHLMLTYAYTLEAFAENLIGGPFHSERMTLLQAARRALRDASDLLQEQRLTVAFPENTRLVEIATEVRSTYRLKREIDREYNRIDKALRGRS